LFLQLALGGYGNILGVLRHHLASRTSCEGASLSQRVIYE
jgi:hypothetical protein